MIALWVAGVGIVAPGLPDWARARPVLRGESPWQDEPAVLPAPEMLPKNERRRATPTIRLALEASRQATAASGFEAGSLRSVFGSSSGDGDVLDTVLDVVNGPEPRVSPTLFHNSVHNAAAGYASIATGSHAASISIGAFDGTAAATLLAAALEARHAPVLMCVYDAALPTTLRSVRDISVPFGAALVLAAAPPPSPVARLTIDLAAASAPPSPPHLAPLGALIDANPSAAALPLLEAIARAEPVRIVLGWEDCPALEVAVAPC